MTKADYSLNLNHIACDSRQKSWHYTELGTKYIRHKISSIIQYVNNVTDMHVIYYITCW